ncbi:MAG: hypothetical protein WBR10_12140, partial [Candidatus Acidiferrum sp.]
YMERRGDPPQQDNGYISFARFKLRKMSFRYVRFPRHHFARHPTSVAQFPHAFAKAKQKTVIRNKPRSL